MGYSTLRQAVNDLDRHGHLLRMPVEVDPYLEMAEIQRRVYAAGGPAILFEHVKGSPFPAVSNLFGTLERARFLFRDTLSRVQDIVRLKADPTLAMRAPHRLLGHGLTALRSLPCRRRAAFLQTRVSEIPQIQSWPDDGGPFITLPQVLTEDPESPSVMSSNVGMYRVQLAGNEYESDREIGLHFQIHRGIGSHYAKAQELGTDLPVSIAVGGPPAHTFSAVMPLPEGLSELLFAGMLGGRRFRYERRGRHVLSSDADFVFVGTVTPGETKPEGPFGDHLGYYSLIHDFPVMRVEAVYHRPGAIWPFTVVGRPPQEDTSFGQLIHEITGPMVPAVIPGLHAMHAVDAAGVHPLLLAIGSERYVPYDEVRRPMELLTIANAILGFGQASLAKYLWIAAREDAGDLDLHDIEKFMGHVLERLDLTRDLHFQTQTTIDTLDYSGTGLNSGSKVVFAAAGPPRRRLGTTRPSNVAVPPFADGVRLAMPGVLLGHAPPYEQRAAALADVQRWTSAIATWSDAERDAYPLLVLCDDPTTIDSLRDFLWATFTRSNPSHDVHGVGSFVRDKHWGCDGPLIIDARGKPHHAPPLIADPRVTETVDSWFQSGGPLASIAE